MNYVNITKNHFSGTIPASICNYHPYISSPPFEFYAAHNDFTNIVFIPAISNFNVVIEDMSYNKFQFGDFENIYLNGGCWNGCIGVIAPQDSVWSLLDTTVLKNTTVTLNATVTGQYNTYNWYKNGTLLGSNNIGTWIIPSVQHSDSGVYTCSITNQYITPSRNLILDRWPITLHVVNSLNSIEITNTNLNPEVFPNPFNSVLSVKFKKTTGEPATISLLNSTGKTLMKITTTGNEYTFNTEKLAKGLYLIKVETGKTVALQKVTKE